MADFSILNLTLSLSKDSDRGVVIGDNTFIYFRKKRSNQIKISVVTHKEVPIKRIGLVEVNQGNSKLLNFLLNIFYPYIYKKEQK